MKLVSNLECLHKRSCQKPKLASRVVFLLTCQGFACVVTNFMFIMALLSNIHVDPHVHSSVAFWCKLKLSRRIFY